MTSHETVVQVRDVGAHPARSRVREAFPEDPDARVEADLADNRTIIQEFFMGEIQDLNWN